MTANYTDETMVFLSTARGVGESDVPYSPEVVLVISVFAGTASLLTVVGNVVVILSFIINKSLRNFSNYMILSLALSDLTIGAFSMNVYTTYNVNRKWILGPAMCKAWLSVDYTASNASVMNLLVICVDRYLAITKPVRYKRWCSPTNAALAIFLVWTISFVMWVPAITLWESLSPNSTLDPGECYIPFVNDSPALSVFTIVIAFYFPAFFMCLLYNRVICKIRQRPSGIRSIIQDASSKPFASNKKNIFTVKKNKKLLPNQENRKASSSDSNRTLLQNVENLLGAKEKNYNSEKEQKSSDPESYSPDSGSPLNTKPALSNSEFLGDPNFSELRPNGRAHTVAVSKPLECESGQFQTHQLTPRLTRERQFETKKRSVSCFVTCEKSKDNLVQQVTKARESSRAYREHRVTVLLKFILLCFIILWLPYSLTVVVAATCSKCIPTVVWNLSYWLCYLNSTVNPFCYGLCNENFRRTFKAILTTRWWTKKSRKVLRGGRKNLAPHRRVSNKEPVGVRNSLKTKV